MFGTPWTTTPTFVVHGQYERGPLRTSITRLPHGRLKMSVPTAGQIGAQAAGGRLTVTLYRAGCRGQRIVLHRALRLSSVVDRKGVARFTFRRPVRQGFYLGRPAFGGNSVILAGRDTDMTLLEQGGTPYSPPAFGFIDPQAWQPCLV